MADISKAINFGRVKQVTEYTNAELVAKITSFSRMTTSTWMVEMGGDLSGVTPANISVSEAMIELQVRRIKRNVSKGAKSLVEDAVDGRKLVIAPEGIMCVAMDTKLPMAIVGGHIVPESRKADKDLRDQIRLDNMIDIMTFPLTKDPKKSDGKLISGSAVVVSKDADKVNLPLYPVVSVFSDNKREDIAYTLRLKCNINDKGKTDLGFAYGLLKHMPCDIPNGNLKMKWRGFSYDCPPPCRMPEKKNWHSFYVTLAEHRVVRGGDTGVRSFSSVGYYYGYMSAPMYRAAYVVNDIVAMGAHFGNQTLYLEINALDGVFTIQVLTSLVANGWVIRVVNGHDFPNWVPTEKEPIPLPKIYHRVATDQVFFVYAPLMENQPRIEAGKLITQDVMSECALRVKDNSTRITFTYIYLRDELSEYMEYLMPSAHAHNGHAIFLNKKISLSYTMMDYMNRCVMANGYKTSHVYHRYPFYGDDKLRHKVPFSLFFKEAKLVGDKLVMNFNVTSQVIDIPDEFDVVNMDRVVQKTIKVAKKKLVDRDIEQELQHDNKNIKDIAIKVFTKPLDNEDNDEAVTSLDDWGTKFPEDDQDLL